MILTEERKPDDTLPRRPYAERLLPRAKIHGDLRPTNLTLTVEQVAWLDARAEREGKSRSDVARDVLAQTIAKQREREERRKKKETP